MTGTLSTQANETANSGQRILYYFIHLLILYLGILHYMWSQDPTQLNDPLNKAMAGIVNLLLWASSAWYAKNGIVDTTVAVGLSAALQAYAVLTA